MSTSLSTFLAERAKAGQHTRVVAFGSSNTERRLAGMHWFDLFELAYKATHGRVFTCINTGRGGDTAQQLLERMERDCLAYQPDLAFVTVGGNDANPPRNISGETYAASLTEIVRRLQAIGCVPVLQTYYADDRANMDPVFAANFVRNMELVRTVACQTGAHLIDHLKRWEVLRERCYSVYRGLIVDPLHLNEAGNLLLGFDVAGAFGLQVPEHPHLREARATHALLNTLCAK